MGSEKLKYLLATAVAVFSTACQPAPSTRLPPIVIDPLPTRTPSFRESPDTVEYEIGGTNFQFEMFELIPYGDITNHNELAPTATNRQIVDILAKCYEQELTFFDPTRLPKKIVTRIISAPYFLFNGAMMGRMGSMERDFYLGYII